MLSEGIVTAIMEASMIGAGLVLAVLAFVAPLSRGMKIAQIPSDRPRIKNTALGATLSLVATFYFYMLSVFMAYGWLTEPYNQTGYEMLLQTFFLLGNAMFMIFGCFVTALVYFVMKRNQNLGNYYP
jgi:hypothetical protein